MPNVIKYSTGTTPTGCLRKGNMLIGNNTADYGATFFNGIDPPTGGYTIYLNKVSGGPSIYRPINDTQLIFIINQIAGASYTTAAQCLDYFASQTDKICINRNYDGIVTNGLTLNLDATVTIGYPNTGTTFYDVSGNANNATSRNTTEFTTFGGKRTFRLYNDGKYVYSPPTDGWNSISNPGLSSSISSFTFETWFYMTTSNTGQTVIIANAGGGNGYRWGPQATSAYWLVGGDSDYAEGGVGSFSSLIGRWVQFIGVFDRANTYGNGPKIYCYVNGSDVGSTTIPTANNMNISGPAMPGNCCGAFDGYVSIIRAYNRALTATEITQNWNAQKSYFGL